MKGLWLENQTLKLRDDLPPPQPKPGEVSVKVLQAGICNTDLELLRGYYPYRGVLGHEFVGQVESGPPEWQGQRVVGEINAACGDCYYCNRNQPTHCQNRTVLGIVNRDGAFAEYLTLPLNNLHRVPENVSTDAATFTEPLAAALEIQQQVDISEKTAVLVVGDGKLGQLVAQTLALTGCNLLVVGRHREKLARLEARGIETALAEEVEAASFEVAVECAGNASGFEVARRALRPRGTLVLKSTYADRLSLDVSSLVVDEITLVGSRCGPFEAAIALLADEKVDVTPLIDDRFSLADGLAAFDRAQTRGTLKVLLSMND